MQRKYLLIIVTVIGISFNIVACAPVIIGSAATVGSSIAQEKGILGNITDVQISTKTKIALYQSDPNLYHHINVVVQNKEVMLTGDVETNEMHLEAVKLAWEVIGVKRVIDNISVAKNLSIGGYARDSWITTHIKTQLLFDKDIQSINYSIKTVEANVYLMGIAQNQQELDKVVGIASNTPGVQKVYSYVQMLQS